MEGMGSGKGRGGEGKKEEGEGKKRRGGPLTQIPGSAPEGGEEREGEGWKRESHGV